MPADQDGRAILAQTGELVAGSGDIAVDPLA